jgi:hypothetical protein
MEYLNNINWEHISTDNKCFENNKKILLNNKGDIKIKLKKGSVIYVYSAFFNSEITLISKLMNKYDTLYMADFETDSVCLMLLYFYCSYKITKIGTISKVCDLLNLLRKFEITSYKTHLTNLLIAHINLDNVKDYLKVFKPYNEYNIYNEITDKCLSVCATIIKYEFIKKYNTIITGKLSPKEINTSIETEMNTEIKTNLKNNNNQTSLFSYLINLEKADKIKIFDNLITF